MKNVVITGATGMVGGYALDHCLHNDEVTQVTVFTRRSTGRNHEKLIEVIQKDFLDYSKVSKYLVDQDIALYCIGVYTGSVPDDDFSKITFDYTKAFADALLDRNEQVSMCFLSGSGADRKETSKMIFARAKGKAENYLLSRNFKEIHIFRPGYIYPVEPRKEPNISYRIFRSVWPLMRHIIPTMGINSDDLGRAIANVGIKGSDLVTYENKDILDHLKVMKKSDNV